MFSRSCVEWQFIQVSEAKNANQDKISQDSKLYVNKEELLYSWINLANFRTVWKNDMLQKKQPIFLISDLWIFLLDQVDWNISYKSHTDAIVAQ